MISTSKSEHGSVFSYFGNSNLLPNVSWYSKQKGGTALKIQCVLPFELEFCASTLLPIETLKEYDTMLKKIDTSTYYTNQDLHTQFPNTILSKSKREMASVHTCIQLPFPIHTKRWQFARASIDYFPEKQQYMLVYKSYQPDANKYPLPANDIEVHSFSFILFTRIDETKTLMQQIALINLHGWATSSSLTKWGLKGRGKAFQSIMTTVLKKKQQSGQTKPYTCFTAQLLSKVQQQQQQQA